MWIIWICYGMKV